MDCGLVHCVASLRPLKQKSSKTFGSQKYGDIEVELEREWPVEPDEYELLHQAGKGASAVVCCARCKPLNEIVAVKKLDLDARCNYDLSALTREATLMKKLQHPNVLPLYTSFVVKRELWMVMPYMAHGSLRRIMKQEEFKEGLDEVVIATVMQYVLEGLDYVHQNGGIHRDIKADNILLSSTGEVRLADFGVAAARARLVSMINLDMVSVMATTFVGTPCWMAPEVMSQEDGYNTSADIWSFGITMIELATGRPPLAQAHPMRVIMDTINNPAPSLDDYPSAHVYSKCMKEVVDACLNKDPFERPSASELLNYRFFRMAKDQDFLVEHFLAGLKVPQRIPGAAPAGITAAGDPARQPGDPQLLGGVLRNKSALGLQDLALGRITSRLKSSWYFPGAKSLANMAQLKKDYRTSDESLEAHDEAGEELEAEQCATGLQPDRPPSAAQAAATTSEEQEEDAAETLAAAIASRTSNLGSFTAGNLLPEQKHLGTSIPSSHLNNALADPYAAVMLRPLSPQLGLHAWDAGSWTPQQQQPVMLQASSACSTAPKSCLQDKLQHKSSCDHVTAPAGLLAGQNSNLQQLAQELGNELQEVCAERTTCNECGGQQQQQQQQQGSLVLDAVVDVSGDPNEESYVEVEVTLPGAQAAPKQQVHLNVSSAAIASS